MKVVLANKLYLSQIPVELKSELRRRMQFDNPKWIENDRMGRWNRDTPKTLKFYQSAGPNRLIIPRGYMRQLILLCRKKGVEIRIEDQRRCLPQVTLAFNGLLKPFQQHAVDIMLRKDFGTLSAPTGSGKTVMALYMVARRGQPSLIIVHTKDLAFQWIERIVYFLGICREEIGLIGCGERRIGTSITVALVQSLYKCASEFSDRFGHVVVDECHRIPSRTFTDALTAFDTRFMLGLSATPWRRDRLSKLIYWHLGDMHHEVSRNNLIAEGHILDIDVISRSTEFKPYYDPIREYSKMLSELTGNDHRNRLIAMDIAREVQHFSEKSVCLVLSDRKRHCASIQAILKHKHHVDADLLTGDLTIEQRRKVIDRVQKGETSVLIATGQLIGEGFDCPSLGLLFLTTPIRFSGRVLQYLGRILRPVKGIEKARVYDYVDIHVPALVAAAQARQKVYCSRS